MARHNELGREGEDAAVAYLEEKGYEIRHRNWRKGHLELDVIAVKDNELVVVEVKTRTDTACILPEEAVTAGKVRRMVIAADTYLKTFRIDLPVRFDIVTVVGGRGKFRIDHIVEAFYPPVW